MRIRIVDRLVTFLHHAHLRTVVHFRLVLVAQSQRLKHSLKVLTPTKLYRYLRMQCRIPNGQDPACRYVLRLTRWLPHSTTPHYQ